ncbi:glycosyltransferase [Lentzea sp. NPDC004782]|uniref:glycosyltransferase n=1 Tax=Lentzea sp. NPDC004782 TaxID=3154458 RepID=UPI0033AD5969
MYSLVPALEAESFKAVTVDAVPSLPAGAPLVVLAHRPSELHDLPATSAVVMPFLWDVWPREVSGYLAALEECRPELIFVTNRWSERALQKDSSLPPVMYVPEAVDFGTYYCTDPLNNRAVGVLEYGRRHSEWHDTIAPSLVAAGVVHQFSPSSHDLGRYHLFETRDDLVRTLRDSVVSVCFPASMTDPRRMRGVEALTARYFESIAAGCLIVGHCPEELVALLGYNPVCEVDWSDPAGQLLEILRAPESWQADVSAAQERMHRLGDWAERASRISEAVRNVVLKRR